MAFWTVKKKIETPSDQLLEDIKNILFPPLELKEEFSEDGTSLKFHVDSSVDSNLDAVLIDLEEGINDSRVRTTISSMAARLNKVRVMVEAYVELDKDAKYIIVDTGDQDNEIESRDY